MYWHSLKTGANFPVPSSKNCQSADMTRFSHDLPFSSSEFQGPAQVHRPVRHSPDQRGRGGKSAQPVHPAWSSSLFTGTYSHNFITSLIISNFIKQSKIILFYIIWDILYIQVQLVSKIIIFLVVYFCIVLIIFHSLWQIIIIIFLYKSKYFFMNNNVFCKKVSCIA